MIDREPSYPSAPRHAAHPPRANRRRPVRRSPAGPGLRRRPASQDILSLPRRHPAALGTLPGRRGGRTDGRDHPILADSIGRSTGTPPRARRHGSGAPRRGHRSRLDFRKPGASRRSRLALGLPCRRPGLLSSIRLHAGPAIDRHAGRGSPPAAMAKPRRRGPTRTRRGAPPRRRLEHRATAGADRGSRAGLCTRPSRRSSRGSWPRGRPRRRDR